ncbi:MAG: NAD-dependent succinate-semialdehyde dehydrogenase [Candidatus Eremiobacteraeota bacterium]|nr:NAD-dependent succinate-semialdehyde dehydrogenase [Candidatus Eremiobacteraeota bacterium]MBC5826598.1 NAD-dependent succinate-semialdehyde dehydrogenase [Candidatus Eremiobacteraeota bacterium]
MAIASINPATGAVAKTFQPLSRADLKQKIERAAETFAAYRRSDATQRAGWLNRAGETLSAEKQRLATLAVSEMGKPKAQALAEIEKCVSVCRYYADNGSDFLKDEPVPTDAAQSFVRYEPLGAILAVMPWNFPYWQTFRFAAPALMAGNVGLLKHASNVPQCALAIEEVITKAGFPEGAFQTLLVGASEVDTIIDDERVKAVTLTGSEAAGISVARRAAGLVKKTVLELGGSDPFIVLASADLDEAVKAAVSSRTINNGQSCIAAKRFLVEATIADRFETMMTERFRALRVGDPMEEKTEIGPLVSAAARDEVESQVQDLVGAGAKVLTGGRRLDGPGYYYAPTVLSGVDPSWKAAKEELFGPVAMLFRVRDVAQAMEYANGTTFGLGASVWTNDLAEAAQLVDGIQAGSVFVNGIVKSDPRLPFGGTKRSGYGRELGRHGIHEFMNVKAVWIGSVAHPNGRA